jgi:hypothetical protein
MNTNQPTIFDAMTMKDQLPMFDLETMQPAASLIDHAPEVVTSPAIEARRQAYANKRAARVARLHARAAKLNAEGNSRWAAARKMAEVIPFGQPVHIGHYSERSDRNYRERIDNKRRVAYRMMKQAEETERRAAAAESNDAISSDNPDAIDLLRAKVEQAKAWHNTMVQANKLVMKKDRAALVELLTGKVKDAEVEAAKLLTPNCFGTYGYEHFTLSNDSANTRRMEARIAQIERNSQIPDSTETIGAVTLSVDTTDNRIRLTFPGKPEPETIQTLKRSGWRWSPYNKAWQRQLNPGALRMARSWLEDLAK